MLRNGTIMQLLTATEKFNTNKNSTASQYRNSGIKFQLLPKKKKKKTLHPYPKECNKNSNNINKNSIASHSNWN